MRRYGLILIFCGFVATCVRAETTGLNVRVEQVPVTGGGELVTLFATRPGAYEVPLFSILKDTLGGPEAQRLRNVWVLTYARPTLIQHVAAALPFLYWRPGARAKTEDTPKPVLDLGAPARDVLPGLGGFVLQSEFFDVRGMAWRAPSRGYRGNAAEYRNMEVAEALDLVARLRPNTDGASALSDPEWQQVQARLTLSRKLLGGLVRDSNLELAYQQQNQKRVERRGHNWELLRQGAEVNGLYFEPLFFGADTPSHALLWISKADIDKFPERRFESKLLGITNPWKDAGLHHWAGYTETWYFDTDDRRADADTPNVTAVEMIPLSVYTLDSGPAPLLLADFRDAGKRKRREVLGKTADAVATGVLGWTGFGHWGYLLTRTSWDWFRHRHGTTVDRTERASSYASLHHLLELDTTTLDPKLRKELAARMDRVALNPFERRFEDEGDLARQQYHALLRSAQSADGLPALLARQRGSELVRYQHNGTERILFHLAAISTFGIYRHREPVTSESLASLANDRRIDADERYLQRVVAAGSTVDVVWDVAEVNRRIDELATLTHGQPAATRRVSRLMAAVYAQTQDPETRRRCLAFLSNQPQVPAAGPADTIPTLAGNDQ